MSIAAPPNKAETQNTDLVAHLEVSFYPANVAPQTLPRLLVCVPDTLHNH